MLDSLLRVGTLGGEDGLEGALDTVCRQTRRNK